MAASSSRSKLQNLDNSLHYGSLSFCTNFNSKSKCHVLTMGSCDILDWTVLEKRPTSVYCPSLAFTNSYFIVLGASTSLTQTSTLLLYLLRMINLSYAFHAPCFRHLITFIHLLVIVISSIVFYFCRSALRVSLWVGSPFYGSGLGSVGPGLLDTTCRFLDFTVTSVRSVTASRASCVSLLSGEW